MGGPDLAAVLKLVSNAAITLGAVITLASAISLGITLKDSQQGGGGQMNGAIAGIIGGAIVLVAGIGISQIPTSWISGM